MGGPVGHLATVTHGVSRRRFFQGSAALAGLALISGCSRLPMRAQPPKVRRIGLLDGAGGRDATQHAPFDDRLRELGYIEGENLVIEDRHSVDPTRFPADIAELEAAGVEAIVCGGLAACLAVKRANPPIPTVIWQPINDAISSGLVQNIARPEGNMTGLAGIPGNLFTGKQLEIFHAAVPDARLVGLLAPANYPVNLQGYKDAASRLGLDLFPDLVTVPAPSGLESAISALKAAGAHGVAISPGTMFIVDEVRARLAELLRTYRLPSVSPDPAFARVGGFLGYSSNRTDAAYRVAWYVDQILKGAKPADLPMERPSKFDFIINKKTAEALGLIIPQEVLAQATEVIQ